MSSAVPPQFTCLRIHTPDRCSCPTIIGFGCNGLPVPVYSLIPSRFLRQYSRRLLRQVPAEAFSRVPSFSTSIPTAYYSRRSCCSDYTFPDRPSQGNQGYVFRLILMKDSLYRAAESLIYWSKWSSFFCSLLTSPFFYGILSSHHFLWENPCTLPSKE